MRKNNTFRLAGTCLLIVTVLALACLLPARGLLRKAYAASSRQAPARVSPDGSADTSIVKNGNTYSFSPAKVTLHFEGDFSVKNTTARAQPMLVGGHYAGTVSAHTTGIFSTLGSHQGIQTFVYHLGDHPGVHLKVVVDFAVHSIRTSNVYHFIPGAATIDDGDPLSFANDTSHSQALLYGGHYAGSVAAHHVGQIWFPNAGTFQVHLGDHPNTHMKVTVKP